MGLFARLKAAGRLLLRDADSDRVSWLASAGTYAYGGFSDSGQLVNARTATSLPTFNACVALLSSTLAAQRWSVERELDAGGSEAVVSPVDAALAQTSYPTKEKFVADALVYGTAYAVESYRDGHLDALAVLPAELVTVLIGQAVSYRYSDPVTGQQTAIPASALAILKYRNWGSRPWLGIPPLMTIGETIGLGLSARGLASSEFRNGSALRGYLHTDGKIDQQKGELLKKRWNDAYTGPVNAWKTPVLEQGLCYEEIAQRDFAALQMAELSRMNATDVCMAFNVPPTSIGMVSDKSAGKSTIEDDTRRLVSLCLSPLAARVGDAIGRLMLSPVERSQGLRVVINLESLVRGFGLELSEATSRYVLGGILTRNEARRIIGFPGRPDCEEPLVPVNEETISAMNARIDRLDATAQAQVDQASKPAAPATLSAADALLLRDLARAANDETKLPTLGNLPEPEPDQREGGLPLVEPEEKRPATGHFPEAAE